jgi:hypothetical protein
MQPKWTHKEESTKRKSATDRGRIACRSINNVGPTMARSC